MREFIIGTDWWTDCDDAAAIRIIARAIKNKKITVKCFIINACMEHSYASLKNFLHLEGIDGISIGLDKAAVDFGGKPPYQKRLAELNESVSNKDAPDACELFIETLKNSKIPLELIELGYPQVLAAALEREPSLFSEKISHVWMMGGKWDVLSGKENNFSRNSRASTAAAYFCKNCPSPITFLGWEVSSEICVGAGLKNGDHLKNAFIDHGSVNGRSAWDPMLAALAVEGDLQKSGYDYVQGTAFVDHLTGENGFKISQAGKHRFVVKNQPDEFYRRMIDDLIRSE